MAGYNTDGVFTAGICEQILSNLSQYASAGNLPANVRSRLGFLNWIQSPLNKQAVEVIPISEDTKKVPSVRIKYQQRVVESEVTTSEDGNCTPERYPDFLETTMDVDSIVSYNFGLSQRQATLICNEGDSELINNQINLAFDALARTVNRVLLGKLLLNFGYNQGVSPASAGTTSINTLVAATGAPIATAIQDLHQDYYESNQYTGIPAVIGQGNIIKYFRTIRSGCCNDSGVDMNALAAELGFAPFIDTQIESVLGTNQFAVMAPGLWQLVPYNRYVGANSGVMGTATNMTITDPVTGLTYDMKVDVDGCNEKYYIRLTLNYGLWKPPVDTFNAEDPLFRINGATRYTAATT